MQSVKLGFLTVGQCDRFKLITVVLSLLKRKEVRLETIADLAGWKSPAVLRQYFKRKTGVSMRKWRNRFE